jgi:hypothetical protein
LDPLLGDIQSEDVQSDPTAVNRLPLIIGVCGDPRLHQNDIAQVERVLAQVFADLRRKYPATPIHLLLGGHGDATALACQVFAAAATAHRDRVLLLAGPPSAKSSESIDYGFPVIRPISDYSGRDGLAIQPVEECLARYTHLVVTIVQAQRPDETADYDPARVESYRIEGLPALTSGSTDPLDQSELGAVVRITIDEQGGSSAQYLFPRSWGTVRNARRVFDALLAAIEIFNRDADSFDTKHGDRGERVRGGLLDSSRLDSAAAAFIRDAQLSIITDLFAVADGLAIEYAQRWKRGLIYVFGCGLAAVGVLQLLTGPLYERGEIWRSWLMALYSFFFAGGVTAAWWMRGNEIGAQRHLPRWLRQAGGFEQKYAEYRALAEALRVQFFWHLTGIDENLSDAVLPSDRNEADWVRRALRYNDFCLRANSTRQGAQPMEEGFALAQREWMIGQLDYFNGLDRKGGAIAANEASARRFRRLTSIAGLAGAALSVGLFAVATWPASQAQWLYSIRHHFEWWLYATALLLAVAALTSAYARLLGYTEHANRYRRMMHRFRIASRKLTDALARADLAQAQRLIAALAQTALEENESWLSVRRERPTELPR